MYQALPDPYIFATLPCRYKTIWVMRWSNNLSRLPCFITGYSLEGAGYLHSAYHNKLLLGYFPRNKFKQSFFGFKLELDLYIHSALQSIFLLPAPAESRGAGHLSNITWHIPKEQRSHSSALTKLQFLFWSGWISFWPFPFYTDWS